MDEDRVTFHGKQVKLDGRHLCDAVDERAAEVIALALTYGGLSDYRFPNRAQRLLKDFFA